MGLDPRDDRVSPRTCGECGVVRHYPDEPHAADCSQYPRESPDGGVIDMRAGRHVHHPPTPTQTMPDPDTPDRDPTRHLLTEEEFDTDLLFERFGTDAYATTPQEAMQAVLAALVELRELDGAIEPQWIVARELTKAVGYLQSLDDVERVHVSVREKGVDFAWDMGEEREGGEQ